ncbi:hypothetical protein CJ430_31730, partial [Klebsiella pneumoniae]
MRLCRRLPRGGAERHGEAIGYGGLYRTTQEQRIGIVACGYADGYRGVA